MNRIIYIAISILAGAIFLSLETPQSQAATTVDSVQTSVDPVVHFEPIIVVTQAPRVAVPSPLAAKVSKALREAPKPKKIVSRAKKTAKTRCYTRDLWQGKMLRMRNRAVERVTVCDNI